MKKRLAVITGVLSFFYFGIPLLLVYEKQNPWQSFLGTPASFIMYALNFMYNNLSASVIIQIVSFFIGWTFFYLLATRLPNGVIGFLLLAIAEMSFRALPELKRFESYAQTSHSVINSDIKFNSPEVGQKIMEYDMVIFTLECLMIIACIGLLTLIEYKFRLLFKR